MWRCPPKSGTRRVSPGDSLIELTQAAFPGMLAHPILGVGGPPGTGAGAENASLEARVTALEQAVSAGGRAGPSRLALWGAPVLAFAALLAIQRNRPDGAP